MKKFLTIVLYVVSFVLPILGALITPDIGGLFPNKTTIWVLTGVFLVLAIVLTRYSSETNIPPLPVILQSQTDEVRQLLDYVSVYEHEVHKSTANIGAYTEEIGRYAENMNKYSEDNLLTNLRRLVDRIESEVNIVYTQTREFNRKASIVLQLMKQGTEQLAGSLKKAVAADKTLVVPWLRSQEQARDNLAQNSQRLRDIITSLRATCSNSSMPHRLKVAIETFIRELDDVQRLASEGTAVVEAGIRLTKARFPY